MQKGKFIVVEGLDGSGKTTLIENIVNSLNGIVPIKSLIDILPRGKSIRECIGNKEHYGNDLSIALLYLSETTRVKDIIEEYLKNGVDVIVDRWFYSTMAYTNNKYIDIIDNVSKYLPNIDMTIYVDVDIDTIELHRPYVDNIHIKCSKCELKAWCRGCPAVANGTNGDFYGADPQCWKIKNERTGERLSC